MVSPQAVASAGQSIASVASTVDGLGPSLMEALASAQDALGDPTATSAMSDVLTAWTMPLGGLGSVVSRASTATSASATGYTNTDACIAQAAG